MLNFTLQTSTYAQVQASDVIVSSTGRRTHVTSVQRHGADVWVNGSDYYLATATVRRLVATV